MVRYWKCFKGFFDYSDVGDHFGDVCLRPDISLSFWDDSDQLLKSLYQNLNIFININLFNIHHQQQCCQFSFNATFFCQLMNFFMIWRITLRKRDTIRSRRLWICKTTHLMHLLHYSVSKNVLWNNCRMSLIEGLTLQFYRGKIIVRKNKFHR